MLDDLEARAKHCTTHHYACDCRELAHAKALADVVRLTAENAALGETYSHHVDALREAEKEIERLEAFCTEIQLTTELRQRERVTALDATLRQCVELIAGRCKGCADGWPTVERTEEPEYWRYCHESPYEGVPLVGCQLNEEERAALAAGRETLGDKANG